MQFSIRIRGRKAYIIYMFSQLLRPWVSTIPSSRHVHWLQLLNCPGPRQWGSQTHYCHTNHGQLPQQPWPGDWFQELLASNSISLVRFERLRGRSSRMPKVKLTICSTSRSWRLQNFVSIIMIGQKFLMVFQFSYTQYFMSASRIYFSVMFYIIIRMKHYMKPAFQINDGADMNPCSI